jgi:hypothetical protein
MKKESRKLRLHRETVRNLQSGELTRVAGGWPGTSQDCDEFSTCPCLTIEPSCYEPSMCFGTCSC